MFSKNETFTVSLKIGGENIKLLIAVDDTVDEVFDRLRSAYPTCTKKKSQIIDKLIISLKLQLHNGSLNQNLLHSISQFLDRNTQQIYEEQVDSINPQQIEQSAKQQVPDKILQTSNESKQNQKASFKKRNSCQSQKQQTPQPPKKKCSVPAKINTYTPKKMQKSKQVGNSVERAKCNPDVIKACEMIMKKAQNNDMRQMAKEFLKEKGYLKEEKQKSTSQHKKKYTISDLADSEHKVQIEAIMTEKTSSHKNQEEQSKCEPSAVLSNITTINACRQNTRFSKYKYLQSSLVNESLSKDYQSFNKPTESSILKSSELRPKKYSYLE